MMVKPLVPWHKTSFGTEKKISSRRAMEIWPTNVRNSLLQSTRSCSHRLQRLPPRLRIWTRTPWITRRSLVFCTLFFGRISVDGCCSVFCFPILACSLCCLQSRSAFGKRLSSIAKFSHWVSKDHVKKHFPKVTLPVIHEYSPITSGNSVTSRPGAAQGRMEEAMEIIAMEPPSNST